MKKIYFLIALFCTVLLHSQERYFLNSDTRLYTSPNTSSAFLGYFRYGAEVRLLSESQNGWYKVQADNFNEGYIQEKFAATRLNAKDVKIKDAENPILEGGDAYYGGNHLFVLVAGLKARALPDKNSKIKEILFTGDPVAVDYVPVNEDDWVNINGNFDEEYARYTLRKFIGLRPNFETLIKDFDNLDVNAVSERKTLSERIVELAWNSEYSKLEPAYQRYYEVVKQINDPKLIAETEMNMALAKGLAKHKLPEQIIAFTKKAEFSLKGTKTKSLYLSQTELVKTFGKPAKKANVGDECGIYLSDLFYYYPDLEVSVDEKKNQAEIVKVYINENNKFIINPNTILDNSVSEKAFIEKYGTYIEASLKSPHNYSIIMEDSQFRLVFKDGKLFSVEIFFYC
ncbi:SH3 domain-containing protein [Flavobacterium johnsoniae]|uniref:SH3, type 3 domain protein n=1 Tax=Flavobacterium johnsoniae (strain ATCC 17061 / DSM 2064 / JCM 8514 / BCRC 14874 / CCUG 350202 / NBRC 14942 / NCIMB 11054 / UW101) TaxID=376686 RepID=A5FAQ4_FLAJ1|nr:SH3 domain-containing protein [Flavobacterium johnsoniae]ABQ07709.1 SH3, type 3 domain protein [Flavobacterium johnsoniae UW101]OXG01793.1 ligand-binding protein SH3 [Flavobacterium johnsoniae UW101]WQG80452.1 SH3 domain-containing protein [Flavobacterium johnsoniae UW101]SHL04639.1 SH3 domain-containing protein [Flavobacterium johnsoniae]